MGFFCHMLPILARCRSQLGISASCSHELPQRGDVSAMVFESPLRQIQWCA